MTQRPSSPDGRPRRREDATRPPRTRRGGDRAPYPGAHIATAPATAGARASARPQRPPTRAHRRTTAADADPTPATVWTCGRDPIDAHETWPVPIVERITTAFTSTGAHVVLAAAGGGEPARAVPGTGESTATDDGVPAPVQDAVRALGRTVTAITLDTRAEAAVPASRPFWADLVGDLAAPATAPADTVAGAADDPSGDGCGGTNSQRRLRADLIVVALPAHEAGLVSLDRLALDTAAIVRRGGIVAVYTHSDGTGERLLDPTGAIVAAAQHADLLYLQHIVALHTPVRTGRLHARPSASVAAEYERAAQRATVHGLPAPHLRAHADILAFAQPAGPVTASVTALASAPAPAGEVERGDRR